MSTFPIWEEAFTRDLGKWVDDVEGNPPDDAVGSSRQHPMLGTWDYGTDYYPDWRKPGAPLAIYVEGVFNAAQLRALVEIIEKHAATEPR